MKKFNVVAMTEHLSAFNEINAQVAIISCILNPKYYNQNSNTNHLHNIIS